MYNDDMMINHHGFQRNIAGVTKATNDLFFVQSAKGQTLDEMKSTQKL